MENQASINRVELTGRVSGSPELRLVPPGCTFYTSFGLTVRGTWPDHTGQTVPMDYTITCFAQGKKAEEMLWLSQGHRVRVFGAIDLLVGEDDGSYVPAVRVREVMLEEAFQCLREAQDDRE